MEARKYSKKREAILEALRNTKEHPSAEMLYARLKPEYPGPEPRHGVPEPGDVHTRRGRGKCRHSRRSGEVRRGHEAACALHLL